MHALGELVADADPSVAKPKLLCETATAGIVIKRFGETCIEDANEMGTSSTLYDLEER